MHKEVAKRDGNTLLIIVGIIVLMFICMSILNNFMVNKYSVIIDIVAVVILILLIKFVIRYKIMDFKYMLIDTDLIFNKILGSKETTVLSIDIEELIIIAPINCECLKSHGKADHKYNLSASLFGRKKYCGIFIKNNKKHKFTFEPTEKLIKLLKRSIPSVVFDGR